MMIEKRTKIKPIAETFRYEFPQTDFSDLLKNTSNSRRVYILSDFHCTADVRIIKALSIRIDENVNVLHYDW